MRDKLRSVVSDYLVGESVPADDVLLDELMYLLIRDVSVGFCFYPLGEVIRENQDESLLSRAHHWSDNVHSPSHERVWRSQGME